MKRAISGGTRRSSPPLPRQRRALRVVQLTLAGVAVWMGYIAVRSLVAGGRSSSYAPAGAGHIGEALVMLAGAGLFFAAAVFMGGRAIRGPRPPAR